MNTDIFVKGKIQFIKDHEAWNAYLNVSWRGAKEKNVRGERYGGKRGR